MKKIDVLIVDDRDVVKDSLKMILSGAKNINVKGEASDGMEAVDMIEKDDFDVVLMDINMPNMNGVEATEKIVKIKPYIKVLASSFHVGATYIKDMISVGASGFITKGEKKEAYIDAIKSVYNGTFYLSQEVNRTTYDKVFNYLKYPNDNEISLSV